MHRAWGWMDSHAGRLVQYNQVFILLEDIQRDELSLWGGVDGQWDRQTILCAGFDRCRWINGVRPFSVSC